MIEKICIKNFKSFGSEMPPLSLCALNFIVGANASGKTNLISALRFLKFALLQNVEIAVNEYGGPGEVRNKITRERDKPKPLHIGLVINPRRQRRLRSRKGAVYSVSQYRYEVEIDLRSQDDVPSVISESLLAQIRITPNETSEFSMKRNRDEITVSDPVTSDSSPNLFSVEDSDVSRLVAGSSFISPIFADFRRNIEQWAFYNINPALAREASKDVIDPELGESGESLATILHRIEKKGGDEISNLANALRGSIPAFKTVKSRQLEVDGKRTFQVIEERLRAGINPHAASDGTIRLLTLMVIVYWSARRRSLVCIEEPETGLHPHLSRNIVEVLRTATDSCQVLATTHNPDFLDELKAEEIILCDKIKGITQVCHATDVQDVAAFQKHFRLGELWEQGTLGGVP